MLTAAGCGKDCGESLRGVRVDPGLTAEATYHGIGARVFTSGISSIRSTPSGGNLGTPVFCMIGRA